MQRFPTSIFAGYVLVHERPGSLDPLAELAMQDGDAATAKANPDAKPQMERMEAERRAMSLERIRVLTNYLEARPDFVYADSMRLELATRLAYVGRFDLARELCDRLQTAGGPEAEQAKRLLEWLALRGHELRGN